MLLGVLLLAVIGTLNFLVPDSTKFVEVEMTVCNGADCKKFSLEPHPEASEGPGLRVPASTNGRRSKEGK